ncbi:MAG TPA: hypothetical protein VFQ85_12345 [Mycobacteriales bacterium]|jgi:hypothetical protein|nr:hypothetical protein [Mycobacteriales bacterium]
MAFRLRPRGSQRGEPGSSRSTQRTPAEPVDDSGSAHPAPQVFTGTTIEPEEGAAGRISNAGDVDPNFKRFGVLGGPGGAGGYGGAGTK